MDLCFCLFGRKIQLPTKNQQTKKEEKMDKVKKVAIGVAIGLLAIYISNKVPAVKKLVGGV